MAAMTANGTFCAPSTSSRTCRAAAGLTVRGIEVDPVNGKFSVLIGQPTEDSDLDDWLMRKKDARQA
jgi:hypothetical protein